MKDIQEKAKAEGCADANKVAGITIPILKTDQTKLEYSTEGKGKKKEYWFRSGQLVLTVRQTIYMPSEWNNSDKKCRYNALLKHESGHTKRYVSLAKKIPSAIMKKEYIKKYFVEPFEKRPASGFQEDQAQLRGIIDAIWKEQTKADAAAWEKEDYPRLLKEYAACDKQP